MKEKKIKKGFTIVNILIALAILTYPAYYVSWEYPMERDVWGLLDRAQISAESDEMYNLVDESITNLENKKGLFSRMPQTSGYCGVTAFYFKQPNNDLEKQYTALLNIRNRLERTNTFDKNSVEYQAAIDDIRGTIREVPFMDCWIFQWR